MPEFALAAGIGALKKDLESEKERLTSEGIQIIKQVINENQEIIENPHSTPEDYENRKLISSQMALSVPPELIHLRNEGEFFDRLIDYLHSSYIMQAIWWFKEQCSERELDKIYEIAAKSDFSQRAKLFFLAIKVINARRGNLLESTLIADTEIQKLCEKLSAISQNKTRIIKKAFNLFFDELEKLGEIGILGEHAVALATSATLAGDASVNLEITPDDYLEKSRYEYLLGRDDDDDYLRRIHEEYLVGEAENIELPPEDIDDWESDYNNYNRYTKIEFPEKCVLDKPAVLTIQLVAAEPARTRYSGKLSLKAPKEENLIRINVIITASQFASQKTTGLLEVPIDADSNILSFKLFPQETGQQQIEIQFDYKSRRIGYAVVKTTVENSDEAGGEEPHHKQSANPVIYDDPAKGRLAPYRHKTLYVDNFGEGKLKYTGFRFIKGKDIDYKIDISNQINLEEVAQNISEMLNQFTPVVNPKPVTWETININLEGIGTDLFTKLIPRNLRKIIRKLEKGTTICISEKNSSIPWEYMYDGKNFLGEKFILCRLLRVDDEEEEEEESDASEQIQNDNPDKKYIVNVVGGGLKDFEKTALSLFNDLSSDRLETLPNILKKPLPSLIKTLNNADILHFTCHCKASPKPMIQVFEDNVPHNNLQPQTVNKLGIKDGALVFANACSSSISTLYFAGFVNFGSRFILSGARIYIGTLGEVPTEYAIEFAKDFYQELFDNRATVGAALAKAKEKAKAKRNIFWLLYCLYGDPDFLI